MRTFFYGGRSPIIDVVISINSISAALGAELSGANLAEELEMAEWALIKRALAENLVIVFRNQSLLPGDLLRIADMIGTVGDYPFAQAMPDYPGVVEIIKEPEQTSNFGGIWHTDTAYLPKPPAATLLYAKQVPAVGGDTLFANMYRVYESLTQAEKSTLQDKTGLHSASLSADKVRGDHLKTGSMQKRTSSPEDLRASHPIFKTHPETCKKSVYASPAHTEMIEGLSENESRTILDSLYDKATARGNVCRISWQVGTLVIWDNRSSLHCAINDYDGSRRHMQRVTIF